MKSKKKLYTVVGMILVIACAGIFYFINKNKKPALTYKEFIIKRDDLEITVQATGTIQPENRLVVKPQIPGRIDEILVQEGQTVKAGQVLGWMSSNDRAALVDMARSASPEEQKRWQEIYKPSPIIAPLGGIVISKQIERGQTVATSDTVFVISDRLIVLAQVDETDLAKIAMGQNVEIRVDAYSEQLVTGKVIRIAYESKQVNNVTIYEIRILPDKVTQFMRSGMTTSVKFLQDKKENVLIAPVSFLNTQSKDRNGNDGADKLMKPGDKVIALAKTSSSSAKPEEKIITVGVSNGKYIEITTGLDEGAVILQPEQNNDGGEKSANPFSPFGAPKGKRK